MFFTIENEKYNNISFVDLNITREQGKFTTSVCHKPTFSGIDNHFNDFLPSTYKIGMVHALLYRCLWIFSDWTKFQLELVKLMDVSKTNHYAENSINNCVKTYINKHRIQDKVIA